MVRNCLPPGQAEFIEKKYSDIVNADHAGPKVRRVKAIDAAY